MSPAVLQYILLALQALPSIIAAGGQLATEVAALQAQLQLFATENRDPTATEWATANAALVSALANLNQLNVSLTSRLAQNARA